MVASIVIFGGVGVVVAIQAVLTMQQFGLKRGPQVLSFILSCKAISSIILTILVNTVKEHGGYFAMFSMCFMGIIIACVCNYLFDEKDKVKYSELYYTDDKLIRRSNLNSNSPTGLSPPA